MSFPRAQVKRFNEQPGCAPPPGHYNMPELKPGVGTLPFDTGGQRFKQDNSASAEDITIEVANQLSTTFLTPSQPLVNSSKKKLNFAAPGAVAAKPKNGSNKTTPLPSPGISGKEKQEFEKEIRRLIQQVNEQDRKLHSKTQDILKLEGKLALLTKDKSSLIAQVAAAEKKTAALEKSNTILQSQKATEVVKQHKREGVEDELKKTKLKYETAKQELDKCRSLLVALQSDLESSRSSISALQQSNHVLTQLNKEVQEHSNDVATQVAKLQGIADALRTEKSEAVEELTLTKEKLRDVKNEFTQLLQMKVSGIEKVFEEKQASLTTKFNNTEKEIKSLQKINENCNCKIQELESEKIIVVQEKNDCLASFKNLKQEHTQCLSQISSLQSSLTSSVGDRDKIKEEKQLIESKVEELQKEKERLSASHMQEVVALNEKLQTLQAKYEEAVSLNEKSRNELKQCGTEKTDLEEKIKVIVEKLEKAETKDTKAQEEISTLTSELEETQKEEQDVQRKFDEKEKALATAEKDNVVLRQKIENSRLELAEFKEQALLMEAKADALETQLMKANQDASRAFQNEELANQKTSKLENAIKQRETQYQAKLSEFTRRLLETQKKLNQKQEELQSVIEAKENDVIEMKNMRKSVEEQAEKLKNAERLSKENAILAEKVNKLQNELSIKTSEEKLNEQFYEKNEKWKKLYDELREKVEPFQGQIDAYSAEKSALLSENSAAHAEMQALGKKYAELLGHQNQKQKIRHVVKIKEENLDLKQEVAKLRTQVAKFQKQALDNRPRKFNPGEAFQHKKENATPFGHNN